MGQYQQWLYAQEVEQRLKVEIETLETELVYLQDRITILEQTLPDTENVILQALMAYQRDQDRERAEAGKRARNTQTQTGRGGLSPMETPWPRVAGAAPYYFGLRSEKGLLPGDILASFKEREQVHATHPHRSNDKTHSLDEVTQRQNENIRRWFERWHGEIVGMARPEETQNER